MTERPKSPREIESGETPIVFVIDDDESMRRALTNLFESVGLRVETFRSAPELLQRNLPDVPSCLSRFHLASQRMPTVIPFSR
jgi:FixJ family two-component response regulator